MSTVRMADGSEYSIMGLQLAIALPYFGLLVLVELVGAAWHYATGREKLYCWNDSFSSLSCGITQQMFSKLALASLETYSYCYTYHYLRVPALDTFWEEHVWLAHLVAFLLIDHQYYWFHRFAHEVNIGWFGHAPHHSSEEYNLTTSLRQGMFQATMSWPFYLPLAVLGITPELYGLHSQINLLYQFWIHTRLIDRLPLPAITEAILNTPSHHRAHHGRNPEYIDKNYGGVLIVFDRLYGTFEPEKREVLYGLVHPLQTFNPLHTQTHHMVDMITQQAQYSSFRHKLQVFLRGPGFDPATQTYLPLPDVPAKEECAKYDPQVPTYITVYAMIQFTVHLVLSVMYVSQDMSTVMTTETAALAANVTQFCYIFASLSCVALLLERGAPALYRQEWWRQLITLVVIVASHVRYDDEVTLFILPHVFYTQLQQKQFDYGYSLLDYFTVFTLLSLVYATVAGFLAEKIGSFMPSAMDEDDATEVVYQSLSGKRRNVNAAVGSSDTISLGVGNSKGKDKSD